VPTKNAPIASTNVTQIRGALTLPFLDIL